MGQQVVVLKSSLLDHKLISLMGGAHCRQPVCPRCWGGHRVAAIPSGELGLWLSSAIACFAATFAERGRALFSADVLGKSFALARRC